jgi:hypothetical protein
VSKVMALWLFSVTDMFLMTPRTDVHLPQRLASIIDLYS